MSWATERRMDWMDDRLCYGETFVRQDLMDYFGISRPQASLDIAAFTKLDPNFRYDRSKKRFYRDTPGVVGEFSVRNSTSFRRQAWQAWPIGQSWCPDADEHRPGVTCYECKR